MEKQRTNARHSRDESGTFLQVNAKLFHNEDFAILAT